jgi:hypothetical protein
MVKRFSYQDSFESLYLLETRLKTSITPQSQAFVEDSETDKCLRHSAGIFTGRHYRTMSHLGLEYDDLLNVARCMAMVFFTRYYDKQPNRKAAMYAMMRFVGQKLSVYLHKFCKKYTLKESAVSPKKSGMWIRDYFSENKTGEEADKAEYPVVHDNLEMKMFRISKKQKQKLSNLINNDWIHQDPNTAHLALELCEKFGITLPSPKRRSTTKKNKVL